MTGVRLFGRGSRVVPPDILRWLLVLVALGTIASAPDPRNGQAAERAKAVDPFLAEDTQEPARDEIPAIPESESPRKVEAEPKLVAPKLTRDIKQTAPPKPDLDLPLDLDPPAKDTPPARAPSLKEKNTPLGDKSGWRSKSLEASGQDAGAPKSTPGSPESARFEREPDLEQLSEPLAEIVVEGNKTIKTEEIIKLLKTRKGRVADKNQIKEDKRTLISKRWFFTVEATIKQSTAGPVLVFKVQERPVLQKVTYVGNKKIKEKALADLTGLKVGGAYEVGANRESARRIENHYREKGYLHVKVELEKGDSPQDREVVFKIEEGPKVVVTKISFSGNKFVSGGVLKTHVKTKTRILWLFGGKYDPATIPEDVKALRDYYQELGFFDVRVTPREAESEDHANIHIEYVVDEGVRYKIRNIEFIGNRVLSPEKLRDKMKVRENEYYNQRWVNVDKEKIEAQYGELGRLFAVVDPHPRTFEEPGYVDLIYKINEDQPYRFGPIHVHISGQHPHTKESVVLTRLTYKPGDLANKAKMKQSEQRLKNTQIFAGAMPGAGPQGGEPPRISPVFPDGTAPRRPQNLARGQSDVAARPSSRPTSKPVALTEPAVVYDQPAADLLDTSTTPSDGLTIFRAQNFGDFDEPQGGLLPGDPLFPDEEQPRYIDTDIFVTETQTGRLSFGVGVNSNLGLLGNITLQENNFDLLRPPTSMQDIIDGTAWRGGGQQLRIQASPGVQYSQYLASWTDPYFLDQNVTLGVSGQYFTRIYPNWFETREGGKVLAGHQFSPYLSGQVAVKAENVRITNPSAPTPPQVVSLLGNNFLSTVRASLVHDTRDSFFLPGKGHYLEVGYEQGMADFVFPKVDMTAKQYFLVKERPDGGSRQIISASAILGWAGNQTPFFERFYAGGFSTFRGFYFYGVTPRINGFRVGGNFEALGSLEYLYPITADNTIQVVAFTDFGTVDSTVSLDAFRLSVGAGFRVSVPLMGPTPIAVDFAVPVMRQPFDTTQLVSFWFGVFR